MKTNLNQSQITDYAKELIHHRARQLVGTAGFTPGDIEDIESELRTDLLGRMPKFDAAKAQCNTFVDRIVTRKISNLIRYRMQQKRDCHHKLCSLNELIEDGESNTVERAQTVCHDAAYIRLGRRYRTRSQEASLRLDVSIVVGGLPKDLRRVAEELKTKTVAQAAKALGLPRSTLYGAIGRLRIIFRDAGLQEYLAETPTV